MARATTVSVTVRRSACWHSILRLRETACVRRSCVEISTV
jgi:hypothetical protein